MTLLEQGRRAAAWRWTPVIVVVLVAGWIVYRLDAGRVAAGEAARLAEAEALRQEGIATAARVSARELRGALRAAVAQSEDLEAEVERLRKAARGARPVVVVRGSTGSVTAAGSARPAQPATSCGDATPAAAPACLLAEGDRGELRVAQALLETRGRNVVFAGAAEAWRLWPEPETRILAGPLWASVSVEKLARAPGWGYGVAGSVGSAGATAGLAVAFPPARAWRWQAEITPAFEANFSGAWRIGATAVVRSWR